MAKLAVLVLLAHFVLFTAFLFYAAPPKPHAKPEPVIAVRVLPLAGQALKSPSPTEASQPSAVKAPSAGRKEIVLPDTPKSLSAAPDVPSARQPNSQAAAQEQSKGDENFFSAQPGSAPDFNAAYLNNPKPPYPRMAIRQQIEGTVTLLVRVLPDGSPSDIRIDQSSGNSLLDDSALKTVKSWRFVPARQGGLPVTAEVKVPIVFSLQ